MTGWVGRNGGWRARVEGACRSRAKEVCVHVTENYEREMKKVGVGRKCNLDNLFFSFESCFIYQEFINCFSE